MSFRGEFDADFDNGSWVLVAARGVPLCRGSVLVLLRCFGGTSGKVRVCPSGIGAGLRAGKSLSGLPFVLERPDKGAFRGWLVNGESGTLKRLAS